MRFVLFFLLMSSALSFAAKEDRNFSIQPDLFQDSVILQVDAKTYIGSIDDTLVSEKPKFPLQSGKLYLRHKYGAKKFGWFVGEVAEDRFQELYAFDLKENHISAREAAYMRFYGSRNSKAFQDEMEIYIDQNFLYTSRVPVIYFVKNGKWEYLNASPFPGKISFKSLPKNATVLLPENTSADTLQSLFPVKPGLFFATFFAPGFYPITEAVTVSSGKVISLKPRMIAESIKPFTLETSVTSERVIAIKKLEEVETLYDQFILDLSQFKLAQEEIPFDSIYPKLLPIIDIYQKDSAYAAYEKTYLRYREVAKEKWRNEKLKTIVATDSLLQFKRDSLEALRIRVALHPVKINFVRDSSLIDTLASARDSVSDSTLVSDSVSVKVEPSLSAIQLTFASTEGRFQVSWTGVPENISIDSLAKKIQDSGQVRFDLVLQNKPVWVMENNIVKARYNYRYQKLLFVTGGKTYEGNGTFELPPFIKDLEEVQNWLKYGDSLPVKKEKPVLLISAIDSDTLKNDTLQEISEELLPILLYRGAIQEIDSGSFRYRGKIVSLSPFAIHKTEVTQLHYQRIMGNKHRKQTFIGNNYPMHNVTWDEASAFCKEIGGTLPTEAQWEYAGRMGRNEGSPWLLDEDKNPDKYSVYRENSYKLGKKNPGYGPQETASKKANEWDLYDMPGNVAEWTKDSYSSISFYVEASNPTGAWLGFTRVIKGGSWKSDESDIGLTKRDDEDPRYWSDGLGFRCVFPSKQPLDPAEVESILKEKEELYSKEKQEQETKDKK